jgi:endonuclease/exonuclease/phosphatase family metal-dependent hydrolase
MSVRIVSYNVRYFGHTLKGLASTRTSKRAIAQRLSRLQPLADVVCLQEVETSSLRSNVASRRNHPGETQLETFMGELEDCFGEAGQPFPYEAFYFRAHTYKFRSVPLYTTGLAILINVRALQVDGHNVAAPEHITHHHVLRFRDTKQSRVCAHMQLSDRQGRVFHVFNTHLSLPTPFAKGFWSEKAKMGFGVNQLQEARTLASFVRRHSCGEPFVVCGDFNSAPASSVYKYLVEEARFQCAQELLGHIDLLAPRRFPTAGFMHLRMHLDHLFSQGIHWTDLEGTYPFGDLRSPFFGLSDHIPLIGRFDLSPAP